MMVSEIIAQDIKPDQLYYIALPNFDNETSLEFLRSRYAAVDFQLFEHFGYTLPVYKFTKLNSYL